MDFLGMDISTREGCQKAMREHSRLVREYMMLLGRVRKRPACEDLVYSRLLKDGYDKDFLDSLDTFTCLPPPGDSLYSGDDSPFDLQYQEILDRMDRDPEELKEEDEEAYTEMDDAEREYSQLLSMTASMVNTFFMLSLDWSQVGIISSMNICPTAMQIQILGILGLATGTCRSAFDRISMRHLEAGRELLEVAHKCALRVHATFKMWASQCPSLNEPLMTRARMLKHTANNLEILISRTEELPGDPPR